jgi:hypothetical protein
MNRYDLPDILYSSIKSMGGQTSIIDVCRYIWKHYQQELLNSGDLFYTWQYDIRWAATELRKTKRMKAVELSQRGIWEII